jgi:hypothetical protein
LAGVPTDRKQFIVNAGMLFNTRRIKMLGWFLTKMAVPKRWYSAMSNTCQMFRGQLTWSTLLPVVKKNKKKRRKLTAKEKEYLPRLAV